MEASGSPEISTQQPVSMHGKKPKKEIEKEENIVLQKILKQQYIVERCRNLTALVVYLYICFVKTERY